MKINVKDLPNKPGIYMFKNKDEKVLYVGKSINIKSRVSSYLQTKNSELLPKVEKLLVEAEMVDCILTTSDFEALILEAHLIKVFQPHYNIRLKDDKRYLYIKMTTGEKFPRVTTARKQGPRSNAVYFGPYPSSKTVKDVLRLVRRIFPYCTQKPTANRRCFYSQIYLCNPCPAEISKLPAGLQQRKTKEYQNNIRNIIKLLSGKKDQVQQRLKREMLTLAKKQKFEEAGRIKKQLDMLEYIVAHKRSSISKYLTDVKGSDQDISRVSKLRETLKPYLKILSTPVRIEGYDISNIQGRQATGAMIVFTNGAPTMSLYRKFRIRTRVTPDDSSMMKEVLKRRLKHIEWEYPDLILVDGGKSQVSATLAILKQYNIQIPVLGLAKRDETVVVQTSQTCYNEKGWREIKLPAESQALQLLQNVRDEAHRFAKKYHVKLREKALI